MEYTSLVDTSLDVNSNPSHFLSLVPKQEVQSSFIELGLKMSSANDQAAGELVEELNRVYVHQIIERGNSESSSSDEDSCKKPRQEQHIKAKISRAHAEQVIPVTENRALSSDLSILLSISADTPFGYLGINETTTQEEIDQEMGAETFVEIILAIILPPIGVFLRYGCGVEFWICLLLTILGYLPGIIYAIYVLVV
ncbi:hypothetical protein L2E82_32362 [Cichorium intybus]|uniref:Uncharacterized protein n=1 Tax=Cichorium intybus TaxID=13427 RepID=A0ACB9BIB6_CICIN|nr:hypothetical protein L2E82_32362 [Cichorium intybus]